MQAVSKPVLKTHVHGLRYTFMTSKIPQQRQRQCLCQRTSNTHSTTALHILPHRMQSTKTPRLHYTTPLSLSPNQDLKAAMHASDPESRIQEQIRIRNYQYLASHPSLASFHSSTPAAAAVAALLPSERASRVRRLTFLSINIHQPTNQRHSTKPTLFCA